MNVNKLSRIYDLKIQNYFSAYENLIFFLYFFRWYLLANPINRVEVEFLPVYTPNAEEVSKPEVYAQNVQKLMADALGVPALDMTYTAAYKEYCQKNNTFVEDKKDK